MTGPQDWYSLAEATEYLRLEKASTLVSLYRSKKIPHSKVGREVIFHRDWLDEYAQGHMVAAELNPYGLTDTSLASIRAGRATGKKSF